MDYKYKHQCLVNTPYNPGIRNCPQCRTLITFDHDVYNPCIENRTLIPGNAYFECSICLDVFTNHARRLSCSHEYHEECIADWIKKRNYCPICRTIIR